MMLDQKPMRAFSFQRAFILMDFNNMIFFIFPQKHPRNLWITSYHPTAFDPKSRFS